MKTVELFTSNGSFVHRAPIPPFIDGQEPEFVIWGNRGFIRDHRSHGLKYRECFWYPLIDNFSAPQQETK